MTERCQPVPAAVAAAVFAAGNGEHWCTDWHAWTRSDGSRVMWCRHKAAIELEVAT